VFARFKKPHRLVLISTVGFAYLALVLLLVWQALRGQSLIHPDVQTLAAAIVLLALTGLSAWSTAAHAKRGYVLCGIRDENNKHRQNKLDMPGPERNPGSWALRKPIGGLLLDVVLAVSSEAFTFAFTSFWRPFPHVNLGTSTFKGNLIHRPLHYMNSAPMLGLEIFN
jgi:hypothetical protein